MMSTSTLTKNQQTLADTGGQAAATEDVTQGNRPVAGASGAAASRFRSGARHAGRVLWASGAILLFLLLWELGPTYLAPASTRVFLPPLHVVLEALASLVEKGQLQNHLAASLSRSASGFGIAVVAAVALGLLVAWYRFLDRFLNPLLEVFRNTAALALLPVFTLLLGIGETSKISIVAYAAFFPVLLNTPRTGCRRHPGLVREGGGGRLQHYAASASVRTGHVRGPRRPNPPCPRPLPPQLLRHDAP